MNRLKMKASSAAFAALSVFGFEAVAQNDPTAEMSQRLLVSAMGFERFNDFTTYFQGPLQREFGLGFRQLDFSDVNSSLVAVEYMADRLDHTQLFQRGIDDDAAYGSQIQAVIDRPITGELSDTDIACVISFISQQQLSMEVYRGHFFSDSGARQPSIGAMMWSIRNGTFPLLPDALPNQFGDLSNSENWVRQASDIAQYLSGEENFQAYDNALRDRDQSQLIESLESSLPWLFAPSCPTDGEEPEELFTTRDAIAAVTSYHTDVWCRRPSLLLQALGNQDSVWGAVSLVGTLTAESRGTICELSYTLGATIYVTIGIDRVSSLNCEGDSALQTCSFDLHMRCNWESSDMSAAALQHNRLLFDPMCAAVRVPKPARATFVAGSGGWSVQEGIEFGR